jgi:hypothetical protein
MASVLVRTVQPGDEPIESADGALLHLFAGHGRLRVDPVGGLTPGDTLRAVGPVSLHFRDDL